MKIQLSLLLVVALAASALAYGRRRTRRPNRPRPVERRTTRDPWPANRQTDGTTRDPWPANRQTDGTTRDPWTGNRQTRDPWTGNRQTRDPWTGRTTTRRATAAPTTVPIPTGRDFCQTLIADGDCTSFYTCFLATQEVCGPEEDAEALGLLINICVQSENVQDDNQFGNRKGNRYIEEYRKCTQRRILPTVDSNTCDEINSKAEEILITDDVIWDCLYQNNTLCDVIKNGDNPVALGLIFAGTDSMNFGIYQHLMRRVERQCGSRAGRQFSKDFGGTFLSNMQQQMPNMMMMMMGGNGGD